MRHAFQSSRRPALFLLMAIAGGGVMPLQGLAAEFNAGERASAALKLQVPPDNKIYHGAIPDFGGTEDEVSAERLRAFESLAGKELALVYFSNNWLGGVISFPTAAVNTIRGAGRTPFIRMMPRSTWEPHQADPIFSMQRIIDGDFDTALTQWAQAAKATGTPLVVEFGTECNGSWFPWNAKYNGGSNKKGYGDPALYDGMERFRDAYKHIIDLFRKAGADNVTWFFHVDAYSEPSRGWNTMRGYYPGDDYIDWIGLSAYGAQEPSAAWQSFSEVLGDAWAEFSSISAAGKPLAILEWGVTEPHDGGDKATWITEAFQAVLPGGSYYPRIKLMSYWHEDFDESYLRIDSSPAALAAYRKGIANPEFTSSVNFSRAPRR